MILTIHEITFTQNLKANFVFKMYDDSARLITHYVMIMIIFSYMLKEHLLPKNVVSRRQITLEEP